MTIEIHPTALISPHADIEDSVRGTNISVGANSIIDSFVKIIPAGGSGDLEIGANTTVNSSCTLYTGNGIRIGSDVAIAANCVFAPTNHEYADADQLIRKQGFRKSKGGILIEDDVWIGAGCVILDGTHVKKGVVIGAMSLVRGEIEPYSVVAGNPLVEVGRRS